MEHGNRSSTRKLKLVMYCSAALLLASCAQIRQLTYPSDFKWIDDSDVQTTMQAMASHLYRMDELVIDHHDQELYGDPGDPGDPGDNDTATGNVSEDTRLQVLVELEGIEALASTLLAGGSNTSSGEEDTLRTNHLLLDEHLNDFIAQLSRARWQLEAQTPSYFGVGQLIGNCNACHQLRN